MSGGTRRSITHARAVWGRCDDVRHEDLPDGFWGDVIDHMHIGDVDAARDAWEDLPDARRVAAPMPTSALYERVLARWRAD